MRFKHSDENSENLSNTEPLDCSNVEDFQNVKADQSVGVNIEPPESGDGNQLGEELPNARGEYYRGANIEPHENGSTGQFAGT
jgi:hypothetical protein